MNIGSLVTTFTNSEKTGLAILFGLEVIFQGLSMSMTLGSGHWC